MRITIEASHVEVSDQLRSYILEKVGKLEQYYDNIIDAIVYLQDEITLKQTEIKLIVRNDTLFVKETGESFFAAIDLATDTMKRSIIKYKEKTLKKNI